MAEKTPMSANTFAKQIDFVSNQRTLNAGIIGLGFSGEVHVRAIRAAGHNVRAIAAGTPGIARDAAQKVNVDIACTAEEMIADPDIDVIHICTPNVFHAPLAELAIMSGKHVICEKPLAISVADAEALTRLAKEKNVVATVPFIYRYYPSVREVRSQIAASFSVLNLIHGYYLQDWLASDEIKNWRIDPKLGGPSRAFGDIGVHWCDIIEFVTGQRIVRLNAQLLKVFEGRGKYSSADTEDGGTIMFETDKGARGSVVLSQVSPGRKNKLWFSIEGPEHSYVFDQESPDSFWRGGIESNQIIMRGNPAESSEAGRYSILPAGHPQGYQDCFNAFVKDTYEAIGGRAIEGMPQFVDGLRAAQLTEAVLRSAETREWVEIA
jgi:predicted dehydrogenase